MERGSFGVPESEDSLPPQVRVRVRRDVDSSVLAELLPAATPGECAIVTFPELLAALHLLDAYVPVNPAAEAAVRRLTAALVARIGGLDTGTGEEWEDRFDALLEAGRLDADAITAYFDEQVFDLAHPARPFLQQPELAEECTKSTPPAKLHFDRSSGNNAAWWDHTPETIPLDALNATEGILLWRGYGPCGLGAQRDHAGTNTKSMKAAPHRSVISYFPDCRDLFLSAVLSCPPPDAWPDAAGPDLAPWETEGPEDPLLPVAPSGPVSLLTARTAHHILARVEDQAVTECWVAWGSHSELPAARDPFVLDREKAGPVRGDHRRGLLRDFDALVGATDPTVKSTVGITRPVWLDTYAQLPPDLLDHIGPVRVRAIGYDQDKREMGDSLAYTATTPETLTACLPARQPARARIVAVGRQDCEHAEQHLSSQLRAAWRKFDPSAKTKNPWLDAGRVQFWDHADPLYWRAVHTIADPARDLAALAVDVYDTVTADMATGTDGFLTIAEHRKWLRVGLTLREGRIAAPTTRKKKTA